MKHVLISKLAVIVAIVPVVIVATPGFAFAHVVVTPNKALTGAYETFTVSVPNEKDVAVTGIRLVIPDSVESVTPTVKPGWQIETKKSGDKITEINWTNGSIPAELRDDFSFSAHVPAQAGELDWKAYQTYQDGSTVSWDQKPTSKDEEGEDKGPYSVTSVSDSDSEPTIPQSTSSNIVALIISIAALAVAAVAFIRSSKK